MPRMSKKRKEEMSMFLKGNQIAYNELCRRCRHDCKQSYRARVVYCPRYRSKRAVPQD